LKFFSDIVVLVILVSLFSLSLYFYVLSFRKIVHDITQQFCSIAEK
jgi:hypothetical protein